MIDNVVMIENNAFRRVEHAGRDLRRFTIYIRFPGDEVEEVDVDAIDNNDAREIGAYVVARDYIAGGRIIGAVERFGLYL